MQSSYASHEFARGNASCGDKAVALEIGCGGGCVKPMALAFDCFFIGRARALRFRIISRLFTVRLASLR